jgi:protein TonB
MAAAAITPRDRLGFCLFVALSLHAALVLGVGFSSLLDLDHSKVIEVTLAVSSEPQANEDADFLAATHQLASGDETEIMEMTAATTAPFQANRPAEIASEPVPLEADSTLHSRSLLTSASDSPDQASTRDETTVEPVPSPRWQNDQSANDLAREIASLEARIAAEDQAGARGPRIKRLTSVSTKSAVEAAYLNGWRQKVERVGNANYPATAMFGNLRMLVVIAWDGELKDVRILQSSGHTSLDTAALRIVRMAAPYQDFPVEMRKHYDQLEIIRTWEFSRTGNRLDS